MGTAIIEVRKMDKEYMIGQLAVMAAKYNNDISPEILGKIVNISVFRIVAKSEIIQHIGETTGNTALVLEGSVRSYYVDEDGNDTTRGFAFPGFLCMDEGLFGYSESICEWETLEECTLMIFSVEKIKNMIYNDELLKDVYIKMLENAIQYKIYRENGFLVENATERYLHFKQNYPEIDSSVSQQYIATYLGITPESLSRIRKALKEKE
jgi:CRP-like cAMP-binding protein